jgi:cell division protein FtsL
MRGRSIVALVLVGFVLVATGVIWRRSYGIAHALDQQKLEQQRAALEAERAKLEGDIRDASSRAKLAKVAEERLNMHIPSDSQVILLKRTAKSSGGTRGAH